MREIGWGVTLLQREVYKTYRRRYVQQELDRWLPRLRLIVVAGPTGCGEDRSYCISCESQGRQVLDLESLANHRGSLLGREPGVCQPSQKWFESSLYRELCQMDLGTADICGVGIVQNRRAPFTDGAV